MCKLEGVTSAAVNLLANSARVTYIPSSTLTPAVIAQAITDIGYETHELVRASAGKGILSIPIISEAEQTSLLEKMKALTGVKNAIAKPCAEHPKSHLLIEVPPLIFFFRVCTAESWNCLAQLRLGQDHGSRCDRLHQCQHTSALLIRSHFIPLFIISIFPAHTRYKVTHRARRGQRSKLPTQFDKCRPYF